VCNDGLGCTIDACGDPQGCGTTPNHAACNDGLACNGVETCDPNAPSPGTGCVAGTSVTCQGDAFACTVESCTEPNGTCVTTIDHTLCPPGQVCDAGLGCVPGQACATDAECDDGDDCNGIETCSMAGICQGGVPVVCDDGIGCTADLCNPSGGTCSFPPVNAICDDGLICNGIETCVAQVGCVQGTPVVCNDNVTCTFDQCIEPSGTCQNVPIDADCDDGVFCNGDEVCTPNDCVAGVAPSCTDNVACTADSCDPVTDQCTNVPSNAACPCGQTCDPQVGCSNSCIVTVCQNHVYECGDCVDNDTDCGIDTGGDPQCLGPCQNNEAGYFGDIPGQNSAPCKQDCYWDGDTGAGNDDCNWNHKCDPFEVAPNYYPEGQQCEYDPAFSFPGNKSCGFYFAAQSPMCQSVCGPITPNGCDCFGCCQVPGANTPIWVGSLDENGDPSCTTQGLNDPTLCHPCTMVPGCTNTCDNCEICFGKPTLPPECLCQQCAPNQQMCGPPCGTPCPPGEFCNSGCCVPAPQ
jgi:hypothetical protein